MPQANQLALSDGTSTVNFAPNGAKDNVYTFINGNGVIVGNNILSVGPRLSPTRRKITFRLACPVVQDAVVNGISNPVQKRVAYVKVEFDFARESVTSERTAIRELLKSALADAAIVNVVDNNEDFY